MRSRTRGPAMRAFGALVVVMLLLFSAFVLLKQPPHAGESAKSQSITWIPLVLVYQFKDTNMICIPDGPLCPAGSHAWNDAKGVDGKYGTIDDCPHCSCYCAPASIAVIANHRGAVAPWNQQDDIYDQGKSTLGETLGNGILETHGVGMFDGTGGWAQEVQASFLWAIGAFTQHDWWGAGNVPMTPALLAQYIVLGHPVLWLDHGGWPANQSAILPPLTYRQDQGHAKVISGYDDNDTLADTSDDLCLIYDPWPEYFDMSILPPNATKGPGAAYDPYWLPLGDVNLTDVNDVFLVDNFPDIPELQGVLVPVIGILLVVAVSLPPRLRKH